MLRDFRFRKDTFTHLPAEQVLQENGLYTLDGYLSYWAMHNQKVLSTVPAERLLIIKTQEISQKLDEITHFTGIKKVNIKLARSHTFKNPNKYGILRKIKRDFLEEKVSQYCQPLMQRFFREIKSMEDAGL